MSVMSYATKRGRVAAVEGAGRKTGTESLEEQHEGVIPARLYETAKVSMLWGWLGMRGAYVKLVYMANRGS